MCDKDLKPTGEQPKTSGCGCAQPVKGHNCPCKKRVCLPILGLVGLAVVASLVAKRRNRK